MPHRRHIPALTLLVLLAAPSPARASSFYIRSLTATQLSHTRRLDTSVNAPRPLTQSLDLYAFDLLDSPTPLHARASLRYLNDFAFPLSRPERSLSSNTLLLDLLLVQWRPLPALELTLGRQLLIGPLGPRDLDGARLDLTLPLKSEFALSLTSFAGLDLQLARSPLAPATFDVQGLPLANDTRLLPGPARLTGVQLSLLHTSRFALSAAYHTRWSLTSPSFRAQSPIPIPERVTGEERAAIASSAQFGERAHLAGALVYNAQLRALERLELDADWLIPHTPLRLTSAFARRRPWFDASSIFNLFDPSPHDDLSLGLLAHRPHALLRRLEARSWVRQFHGDDAPFDLASSPVDGSAWGVQLSQSTSWRSLSTTTRASYQHASRDAQAPHQWLFDQRLDWRIRALGPSLYARAIALHVDSLHPRRPDESALSAILGLDTELLTTARLKLVIERRLSTNDLSSLNAYAVIEIIRGR